MLTDSGALGLGIFRRVRKEWTPDDGTDADTIPVPATNVMLLDAYREDPDRADCLVLSVFPCWVNCEAVADRETEDTLPILECEEKDLLTFLEKGPSHK